MSFPIVSLIVFIPLIGAIIVALIPRDREREIKWFAVIVSLIPLLLSIIMWSLFVVGGGMRVMEEA